VVWANDTPRRLGNIDISVAVATDNGLITPIVKNAISLGVQEISDIVKVICSSSSNDSSSKKLEYLGLRKSCLTPEILSALDSTPGQHSAL